MGLAFWVRSGIMTGAFLALIGCGEEKKAEAPPPPTLHETGAELVATYCVGCHTAAADGSLSRISHIRKTPEGWAMTLARMDIYHGVKLSADERQAVVKFLADTQGLAPEETKPYRYALERRANVIETGHGDDLMKMCARCHSYARVGLQHRDADEWRLLFHTHMGQWPSLEYQMLSRERDWWDEAQGWVAAKLGKSNPLTTEAWTAWKAKPAVDLSGAWRFVGYMPGEGFSDGALQISMTSPDQYAVTYNAVNADGAAEAGDYKAILYTNYEWRARGAVDKREFKEVAAVSDDGEAMTGRLYFTDSPEIGTDVHLVRADRNISRVMAVSQEGLKRGTESELTIYGVGLAGVINLGDGVTATVVSTSPDKIVVKAAVAVDAPLGRRGVAVGSANLADAIAVYDAIDRVDVTPGYAVARLGGGGGKIDPVSTQFEAVAYANGRDKKPNTKDDFRIGVVSASWDTAPFDDTAADMKDHLFAGKITPKGRFLPAPAGPNSERKFGTSNAGDLKVIATVTDGERTVTGEAHLIVSAQRWNNPPIY